MSHGRVAASRCRAAAGIIAMTTAATVFALVGCAHQAPPAPPNTPTAAANDRAEAAMLDESTGPGSTGAHPRLASDPAQLADDLVADEQALRDPSTAEPALAAAARRQQAAYRAIGRHPEWDETIHPRIPAQLMEVYDRNIDARRQLAALAEVKNTVPAWRIEPPAPAYQLMGYYREAEAANGVDWNYLAAINLIETRFGSIDGVSTAGAHGPMQFMPSTFAAYGEGGDIRSPRDSIMAAGRFLAASGYANDRDRAIYQYNQAAQYVSAVNDYAAVLAADPAAFGGYYRWDVYYLTTAGDVLLPIGYAASAPIPVGEYLAGHPQ